MSKDKPPPGLTPAGRSAWLLAKAEQARAGQARASQHKLEATQTPRRKHRRSTHDR
jgi:hypothetical protein